MLRKGIFQFILLSFSAIVFGQNRGSFTIGVLIDEDVPEVNRLYDRLKNEVSAVVGEDAELRFPDEYFLVNNFNPELAKSQYKSLEEGDPDIILAFGINSFMAISSFQTYAKPTIIFGNAPFDFLNIDNTRTSTGINNLSFIITPMTYKEDLKTFYDLYTYTNIGIAVDQSLNDVLPYEELIKPAFTNLDVSYKIIPFSNPQEIINELDSLDALYLSGGFLLTDNEIKSLADTLIARGIPSFTTTHANDVVLGLLATNQSTENDDQIIRRVALNIEAIINGENPSELPLFLDGQQGLTINYNTSEQLGLSIRYSLLATTTLVGDLGKSMAEVTYDLPTVINEVIESNLNLQASSKSVALSEQDVKSAKSNYLPDVTATASSTYVDPEIAKISNGQNPEYQTQTAVTLNQTIYSPDASAGVRINRELKEAQQKQYEADQLNTIFEASNAYFNTLLAKATLIINEQNLELTKNNLKIATHNYEAGQAGKPDVLRFRSQLAQNTQSLIESVTGLKQTYFDLNQLLNQPMTREIEVEDVFLDQGTFERYNYDELKTILDNPNYFNAFSEFLVLEAKKNSPELQALDYNLNANDFSLRRAANGRFAPTLALQGQYQYYIDRSGAGAEPSIPGFPAIPESNYYVGLNLSLPIFERNIQNINKQTATIQREQIMLNKQNTQLGLERNVNVAVLQLINQIANLEVSKVSEEAARETLELTQDAYSRGAVNVVQLLDAQTNYLRARIANATAVYTYLISALQLERTIGYFFMLHTEEENQDFMQRFITYFTQRN
ncbi:TolC family protein [Roseivirga pacifica]|uniref:TolC family protein n=1 Tax=Roseivirga pacifica TaxID=1267423 RepID=UPI00227D647A|nr:TolC family protein [Roseivirga pacifica]